jgi:hypothetical protein
MSILWDCTIYGTKIYITLKVAVVELKKKSVTSMSILWDCTTL